jgi:hypothetical protein
VVDTFGSYAFGFLHTSKQPEAAVAVLHNDVLPFYQDLGCQFTGYNAPQIFAKSAPGVFTNTAPRVFTKSAPVVFGQNAPPSEANRLSFR